MRDEISIREWQARFAAGEFDDPDFRTQVEAGWYDWFCSDKSLAGKTKRFGRTISKIKDGGKVDLDNMYVFFKNNCPCVGPLYDDFRICRMDNDFTVYLNCQFNCKRDKNRDGMPWHVFGGPDGQFDWPIASFANANDMVKWLNEPWEVE